MFKKMLPLMMIAGLMLTVGCTTVTKYAAIGAAGGAAVGAVAGEVGSGLSTFEAALVGASVGGLGGALVGDMVEEDRASKECKDALNKKDAEIAAAQEAARAAERELAAAKEDLAAKDREIDKLNKALENCQTRVEMTLEADVLFASGSARLTESGKKALMEVAKKIKDTDKNILVEGHTDTDPIKVSNWKDNWDLGAARALTVLRFLIKEGGIDPAKCGAATFSEYQPVGADKAKNRRAVIALHTGWKK